MVFMERLDKIFSNNCILSRKDFKKAVKAKDITVNGDMVSDADIKVNEDDIVMYKGNQVSLEKYIYIMLNKPLGVVSSTDDKENKTVIDILPKEFIRKDLFPCGRLDKDTTGLLIITNDGASAHKRLSPKNHVEKSYYFELKEPFKTSSIEKLENGITLKDGLATKPCKVEFFTKTTGIITITEGKYHEIRRMFAYFSNTVTSLKRISFGDIKLDENLKEGEARLLTNEEIEIFKG